MGVYRLQAQLKVSDLAVAHPSGMTSVRIDTLVRYCSWGAGGQLAPSWLRGAGAVLPRLGGGGLENTACGDSGVEICCLAGIREGESWLFRLCAISTVAIWGPSPNQKLPPWLLCSIWVCSRKASWFPAFLVSIYFLCLSLLIRGGRGGKRLGCLFIYMHHFYRALTPSDYEITERGKNY